MKKIMFMAALAALSANAEIYSKNIVGYQTQSLTKGSLVTSAAMFKNTTGDTLDLANITLNAGCPADGTTYVMWWEGKWVEAYWVELDFDPNNIGWGDFDNWAAVDKTFEVGEAFFVLASSVTTDPTITASGAVLDVDNSQYAGIELPKGSLKFVSNPFPGELSLADIKLSDGCPADGTTYVMWWEGKWVNAYWVELDFDPNNIGWGDFDNWAAIEKDFINGEGYFVLASSVTTEPEILFPNPLYVAPAE